MGELLRGLVDEPAHRYVVGVVGATGLRWSVTSIGAAVGAILLTAGACGGGWTTTDRVISSTPARVCVDGRAADLGDNCFDPREFDFEGRLTVGDCVRINHWAESAAPRSIEPIACS